MSVPGKVAKVAGTLPEPADVCSIPQTPQRLRRNALRDTIFLSSLPVLDWPTSMLPFRDPSNAWKKARAPNS